jgi:hypothetical protein
MGASSACSRASAKTFAARVSGKGRAVFAAEPIARDEIIGVFGGVIVSLSEALGFSERQMTQCIQIEEDWVLWTGRHKQTVADWINHSCAPNAGIAGQITIVALRDIAAGEEICFDYAMCSTCLLDDFDCRCGMPGCRGHVGPDDWRMPDLQARYRGYFSSFLERRIAREALALGAAAPPPVAPESHPSAAMRAVVPA